MLIKQPGRLSIHGELPIISAKLIPSTQPRKAITGPGLVIAILNALHLMNPISLPLRHRRAIHPLQHLTQATSDMVREMAITRPRLIQKLNDMLHCISDQNAVSAQSDGFPLLLDFEEEDGCVGDHGVEIERYANQSIADVGLVDDEAKDGHGAGDGEVCVFTAAGGYVLRGEVREATEGEGI
jgi:hypothetical protein